jgi:hypothetical protein
MLKLKEGDAASPSYHIIPFFPTLCQAKYRVMTSKFLSMYNADLLKKKGRTERFNYGRT